MAFAAKVGSVCPRKPPSPLTLDAVKIDQGGQRDDGIEVASGLWYYRAEEQVSPPEDSAAKIAWGIHPVPGRLEEVEDPVTITSGPGRDQ